MKIIEFFGPSGSGKTNLKKKLLTNYLQSKEVYSYKSINYYKGKNSIFINSYFKIVKSKIVRSLKDILQISQFKNSISNFFFKEYFKNIQNHKFKNQDVEKLKKIKNLINNSNFNNKQKKIFLQWLYEEFVGSNTAKYIKNKRTILIDSEGLIQRLFIYCYKKKNKNKIIQIYLNLIRLPNIVVYFDNFKTQKKNFLNLEKKELQKIFILTLKNLRKKNTTLIDSNTNLEKISSKIKG